MFGLNINSIAPITLFFLHFSPLLCVAKGITMEIPFEQSSEMLIYKS